MISDLDYIYVCDTYLFPKLRAFAPQVILISAGFDSALNDPLGGVGLTPLGFAWMTHGLHMITPHLLVVLEGGYEVEALGKCSQAVIETLFVRDDAGFS